MKFLAPQGRSDQFRRISDPQGTLYLAGQTSSGTEELLNALRDGRLPARMFGNFAFVWEGERGCIAAVDHLATHPLFYDEDWIGPSFFELRTRSGRNVPDKKFAWELRLLQNMSVTDRTPDAGVRRLLPGTAWVNGKVVRHFDIADWSADRSLDPRELRAEIEASLRRHAGERNVLFVSGGTDSSALAAACKTAGLLDRFRFVNLHSSYQLYSEVDFARRLAARAGIEIEYLDVGRVPPGGSDPGFATREMNFGVDRGYMAKVEGLRLLGAEPGTVFTGEIGDQLLGGEKVQTHLLYAIQSRAWSAEDIARQFVHISMNGSDAVPEIPLVRIHAQGDPLAREVYEEIVALVADLFGRMRETDLVNRLLNLNFAARGPFRLMPYTQSSRRFAHPFADWRVVELCLRARSSSKIHSRGRLKAALYEGWRELLPVEIWKAPKNAPNLPIDRDFHL